MRAWLWLALAVCSSALVALAVARPGAMLSPGPLVPAHAALANDCFACHAPFGGATSERCVTCHVPADIGLRTTRGMPVAPRAGRTLSVAFHQELREQRCTACHGEHQWRAARPFSHDLLSAAGRARCESCHSAPADAFHQRNGSGCARCHGTDAWRPAAFDHRQSFALDGDHAAPCATCHTGGDLSRYTCFGCHAHTPANVREEHDEEGIAVLDDCASCHRSADAEGAERGEDGERGEGGEGGEHGEEEGDDD
jgi:hypothetical protein